MRGNLGRPPATIKILWTLVQEPVIPLNVAQVYIHILPSMGKGFMVPRIYDNGPKQIFVCFQDFPEVASDTSNSLGEEG